MITNKLTVIYILGTAHSGSTLLDLILGSHFSVVSTGELWAFPYWVKEDRFCSCGEPIRQCPFWARVLDKLSRLAPWSPADLHPLDELRSPSRTWRIGAALGLGGRLVQRGVKDFGEREWLLFTTIAKVAGAKYVVDSSKRLDRLLKLYHSGALDLKIVHLVRDGHYVLDATRRAAIRRVQRLAEKPKRRYQNSIWIYSGWIVTMLGQLRFLSKLDMKSYYRLSYEELATNPYNAVKSLCDFLHIGFEPDVLHPASAKYVFKQKHHIIGGSRLTRKIRTHPETPIVYHDTWEKNLSRMDRWTFVLLGGHLINRRLGIGRRK